MIRGLGGAPVARTWLQLALSGCCFGYDEVGLHCFAKVNMHPLIAISCCCLLLLVSEFFHLDVTFVLFVLFVL